MKIKIQLTILIALVTIVTSCKKSDKSTGTPPPTVKKLKYLTRMTIVQGTSTRFVDYTYDDKKRLITEKTDNSQTTYTYNGNDLFSVEVIVPSNNYLKTTECTYNDDGTLLSTHDKVYENNTLKTETVYTYVVVNGRITERHYNTKADTYTYDERGNPIDPTGSVTYDDKPNIFTNGFPNPNGLFISPNNKTSSGFATYTYTYGADGFPIGAIVSGTHVTTTKYAYTYTEM